MKMSCAIVTLAQPPPAAAPVENETKIEEIQVKHGVCVSATTRKRYVDAI